MPEASNGRISPGRGNGSSAAGSRQVLIHRMSSQSSAPTKRSAPPSAKVGREWLESRIDLAEQSQRVYSTYLDSIEDSPLREIRSDIGSRLADVRAQIARWSAEGLAPKSVRERVSVLRQVLDFAGVEPNPARNRTVRLPARAETELVLPSADDIVVLATDLPKKFRLPFVILEQTAMRVSELVSLERDDVDAAGLRFRVKAINRKGVRGSRRARFVPVPPWLMEIVATSLPIRGRLFPDFAADGLRASMRDICRDEGPRPLHSSPAQASPNLPLALSGRSRARTRGSRGPLQAVDEPRRLLARDRPRRGRSGSLEGAAREPRMGRQAPSS